MFKMGIVITVVVHTGKYEFEFRTKNACEFICNYINQI